MTKEKESTGSPFIYCEGKGRKERIREIHSWCNCHNYFWSVNVLTMIVGYNQLLLKTGLAQLSRIMSDCAETILSSNSNFEKLGNK